MDIVIYGAGYIGLMFCDLLMEHNITPICIMDKDVKKAGKLWNGKIPIRNIEENVSDIIKVPIIICILNTGSISANIRNNLEKKGFTDIEHIMTFSNREENTFLFKNQKLILHIKTECVKHNFEKISNVKNMLSDDLSRLVYGQITDSLCNGRHLNIKSLHINQQYFAYDLFSPLDDEVFIDCGAYDGTVFNEFNRNIPGKYKRYYAFEPDLNYFSKLVDRTQGIREFIAINKAVGEKQEAVFLKNYMDSNSVISSNGGEKAECVALDSYNFGNDKPTFLKIDVEGYETKVLRGAVKLIQEYKPVIACALYHKEEDFWEIPLLIKNMVPEYSLYVRSYLNLAETILYAVPDHRRSC